MRALWLVNQLWFIVNKSDESNESAKILANVQTFRDCAFHQWMFVMSAPLFQVYVMNLNFKVAFSTLVWTSNEVKISIEAARLACLESKDETHFLLLPLFVPTAEFDSADQSVGYGMSVRTKMLCDGKTRRILDYNASEILTKTFPHSAPSLAGVIMAGQRW